VCALTGIAAFELSAESAAGRLSDAGKAAYRTDMDYSKLVQESASDTLSNFKGRFEIEYSGFSQKPPSGAYAKLLSKAANISVSFKGESSKLPVFINETDCPFIIKRLKEAKPGTKFFVYASMKRTHLAPEKEKDKKGKEREKPGSPTFIAVFQVDDILTADEESSFRAKKDKLQQAPERAPVFPDQQATAPKAGKGQ